MENLLKEFSLKSFAELNSQFKTADQLDRELLKIFIQYIPAKTYPFLKLFSKLEKINFLIDILLEIYNEAILSENYENIIVVIRYLYYLGKESDFIAVFKEKCEVQEGYFLEGKFAENSNCALREFNSNIHWDSIKHILKPYSKDIHHIINSTYRTLSFNFYKLQTEIEGLFLSEEDFLTVLIEMVEFNFPFFTRFLLLLCLDKKSNLKFILQYFKGKDTSETERKFIAFLYENVFTNHSFVDFKYDFKELITEKVELEIRAISNINTFNDFMDRKDEPLYKYSNEDFNELRTFALNTSDPSSFHMNSKAFIPLFFDLTRPSITHFLTYFKFFKPYILSLSDEDKKLFLAKISENSQKRIFYERIILKKINFFKN